MQAPEVPALLRRQVKPIGHGVIGSTQLTGVQKPF
jgi:hypothetical protein